METAEERKKRIARTASMRLYRNRIYEIGRLLHPEEEPTGLPILWTNMSLRRNSRNASFPRRTSTAARSEECMAGMAGSRS